MFNSLWRRVVRGALTMAAVFAWLSAGCGGVTTVDLSFALEFDSSIPAAVVDQVQRVDLFTVETCGAVEANPTAFRERFTLQRMGSAPQLGRVSASSKAVHVLARNGNCEVVAAVCQTLDLSQGGQVTLTLGQASDAGCASDEICSAQIECVPNMDLDAGPGDAAMDAGDPCGMLGEGSACQFNGSGTCRAGVCCTGCWNGSACLSGTTSQACGVGGQACGSCDCASDICPAGACETPLPVAEVSLNQSHACAVINEGLYCWGQSDEGQFGNGMEDMLYTSPVPQNSLQMVQRVQALDGATCILGMSGHPQCFGSFQQGRLGLGVIMENVYTPMTVVSVTHDAISASDASVCAIEPDGTRTCWGNNQFGELGLTPTNFSFWTWQTVNDGIAWKQLAIGADHSCGVGDAANNLYCFGRNQFGELGLGDTMPRATPTVVSSVTGARQVAVNLLHTCAIDGLSDAYCWGFSGNGELGNGERNNSTVPVPVAGSLKFNSIALGIFHSCGIVSGNTLYCWGSNENGQLGNGNMGPEFDELSPIRVGAVGEWVAVRTGLLSTCGIKTDGTLWCWGNNFNGVLGVGDVVPRPTPTRVCF